jgi:hypothetical protein
MTSVEGKFGLPPGLTHQDLVSTLAQVPVDVDPLAYPEVEFPDRTAGIREILETHYGYSATNILKAGEAACFINLPDSGESISITMDREELWLCRVKPDNTRRTVRVYGESLTLALPVGMFLTTIPDDEFDTIFPSHAMTVVTDVGQFDTFRPKAKNHLIWLIRGNKAVLHRQFTDNNGGAVENPS